MKFEVGLCLRSVDLTPFEVVNVARRAEEIGFQSLWMTEEMSRASPPLLALAASATSRIKVGTAILNIFARTPMNTAMTSATLQEISGNRFLLGLGVGGPDITRKGHGVDFSNPTSKMEEYVEIVRKFLTGERVVFHGRFYNVDNVRLWLKTAFHTQIYLGSLNPKMLTLAGKIADGIILNMFDPAAAFYVDKFVEEGLKKSSDPAKSFTKYSFVLTAASRSSDSVAAMKKAAGFYMSSPPYRKLLIQAGHGAAVQTFLKTMETHGRDKAAQTIEEGLLEKVGLFCDEDLNMQLNRFTRAGIEPLIYPQPRPGKEKEDIDSILTAFAKYLP